MKKGKEEIVDRVYSELKDGLDFSKAVRVYSDSESGRENGGKMPPVLLKDLAPVFRQAIEGLDEKQFTAPVKVGPGAYFFYLEKKEFAGNDEFRKVKGQLGQRLRQEQIGDQTMKWIENQRRRSEIKIID
ncbi:peptidylprolyl isomerase [Pseudobacteriovorax antillogorgiicola]|uniref:peptidylprolyl isomerase n=1 Tax=Pseudobacteriovorax antillogorgiicola TaxID=1513793 RepID=UPI00399A7735